MVLTVVPVCWLPAEGGQRRRFPPLLLSQRAAPHPRPPARPPKPHLQQRPAPAAGLALAVARERGEGAVGPGDAPRGVPDPHPLRDVVQRARAHVRHARLLLHMAKRGGQEGPGSQVAHTEHIAQLRTSTGCRRPGCTQTAAPAAHLSAGDVHADAHHLARSRHARQPGLHPDTGAAGGSEGLRRGGRGSTSCAGACGAATASVYGNGLPRVLLSLHPSSPAPPPPPPHIPPPAAAPPAPPACWGHSRAAPPAPRPPALPARRAAGGRGRRSHRPAAGRAGPRLQRGKEGGLVVRGAGCMGRRAGRTGQRPGGQLPAPATPLAWSPSAPTGLLRRPPPPGSRTAGAHPRSWCNRCWAGHRLISGCRDGNQLVAAHRGRQGSWPGVRGGGLSGWEGGCSGRQGWKRQRQGRFCSFGGLT